MKNFIVVVFTLFVITNSYCQDLPILWQTDSVLQHPESIVYHAKKSCFYVSNMNKSTPAEELHTDAISKFKKNGKKVQVDWMTGLSSPTGMFLKNDTLFVVERDGVALISVKKRKILKRIPIQTTGFLNDITIDEKNRIFVTETEKNRNNLYHRK